MPFVLNGVIIPEDTANAFSLDGVDITDVFLDGVQVFNQRLFSDTWSGSSLADGYGMETSGNLCRAKTLAASGAWITLSSIGVFTAGDSLAQNYLLHATSNTLEMYINTLQPIYVYPVTFNPATNTWSGGGKSLQLWNPSYGPILTVGIESSGANIRFASGTAGAWITLI